MLIDQLDEPVSIRAPAKGATREELSPAWHGLRFNPRPREGGDTKQSCRSRCRWSFNPRPREGGDDPGGL